MKQLTLVLKITIILDNSFKKNNKTQIMIITRIYSRVKQLSNNKLIVSLFLLAAIVATSCRKSDDDNLGFDGNAPDAWLQSETWMNFEGWTEFTPSADTRIMYVAQNGNNATAQFYSAADAELGSDPFNPSGAINAYASYDAAAENMRDGFPDWILFKRGDSFSARINPLAGRGEGEYSLISAYGESGNMPIIVPVDASTSAIRVFARRDYKILHYSAVTSIDFYSETRDPSSSSYQGTTGASGFSILAAGTGDESGDIKRFLIEGCKFRFFDGNVIQIIGEGAISEIAIRRTIISDNYSEGGSHSQGLYTNGLGSILLEENIFDHNGWLNQAPTEPGRATMFNHNTYFSNCHKVKFSNNIFLRPSSMHNKFTANNGVASSTNIALFNNIYVDGEIGIGLGGNEPGPSRFQNVAIKGNVLTEIGRSQPTNRGLGWYILINGWNNGIVQGNYTLFNSTNLTNTFSIGVGNDNLRNVKITENVSYDILGYGFYVDGDYNLGENVEFTKNKIIEPNSTRAIINADYLSGISISENIYFADNQETFSLDNTSYDFADWTGTSNDNSTIVDYQFTDPTRSIETYQAMVGGTATIDGFVEACRAMNRYNWDENYSALKIGEWIKAGFAN